MATWIVPPTYEAVLLGASAVIISARKIRLLDLSGQEIASVGYRMRDGISSNTKSFSELVAFVRNKTSS